METTLKKVLLKLAKGKDQKNISSTLQMFPDPIFLNAEHNEDQRGCLTQKADAQPGKSLS